MSISLLDNLSIKKKSPNVERDLFNTVADMVAFSENYLPSVFECNVIEDGNRYRYNVSNSVDPDLGKWRLVSNGGSGNLVDYYKKTETDVILEGYVTKEAGKGLSTNDYTTLEKEKLASLENYDDTDVKTHITTSEQAITDIQIVIGTDALNTTAQTLSGAINEVKFGCDTTTSAIAERVTKNEQAITVLNGDVTVNGSIKETASTTLSEAKTYTDHKIETLDYDMALVCDEKPVYNADDDTITYIKDGITDTTEGSSIWFYYMDSGKLMQTIWIGGEELTVVSAGGVNFAEYVSKLTDIVSTYTGSESDTTKIPNIAAMKALQIILQTNIDDKISGDAILDVLDSSSTNSALSANQGRVLNEALNTKLNKTFIGDNVASKPLVTDTMGNVILGAYDDTINSSSVNAVQNKVVKAELDKKLNVTQDTANANKVLSVREDGTIGFTDPSVLGGSAELTSWTHDTYPDLTNVDLALRNLFAKVYYEAIAITSFTCSANSEYEIGTVLPANSITFTWAYNKDATGQTLTDCAIELTDRECVYTAELSNTKTFILSCSDGTTNKSSSKKISFLYPIYYGCCPEVDEYGNDFILALDNKKLTSSNKMSYNFNCGSGEYAYFATPTNMKVTSAWVNGFQSDVEEVAVVSHTNVSGHTSSYTISRFSNSGLGSFSATVQ